MGVKFGNGLERVVNPKVNQFLQFLDRRTSADLDPEELSPVHLCVVVHDEFLQRDVVFRQPATMIITI